ncbi:uncharacterized protein LOC108213602 isoform X2 [Daucus carota subsp. sativus]|uniref:uncharacterized protein LOC108213602 isoform X2 n=1 Tax=Daucus carota subsp. sativus TaxID=79200 RepID=UPI0007EF3F47|nr:PREDICTED: uncharacterized protein LOC108213602 isoform X2 [Daucus carota subsp. sativus]
MSVTHNLSLYYNILLLIYHTSSTSYLSLINSNLPSFQKIVMDTPAFDRISKLTCNKTSWTIKVRLTRLWKSINAITGDFKGYNMILLDDDKTHIHAFAGLDFVNEMDDVPEERKVYNISEFNVDDAKYSYVAVSNKSEIYFLKRTNMTLIEEEDDMIPKYKFELVSLNALKLKVGNTKILTDLIGLVVNVLPMQSRNTPTGPKDILLIDITDGSEKIRVTIWAEQAHELKEELEKWEDKDRIIIIMSCCITEYRKQLQANSLSPSKFYINPDYDAVHSV